MASLINAAPPPVLRITPPDHSTVDEADAYSTTRANLSDWLARQRAEAVRVGLADPETGLPTKAGLINAAQQVSSALLMGTTAPEMRLPGLATPIPVRPATENVQRAMDASFVHGKDLGPSIMPVDQLSGGVALTDPKQAARVSALKEAIVGPTGYISRPIVDADGNVIEGQHRLEALRQLGATEIPVHVVKDLASGIDTNALTSAIRDAQKMHPDQSKQLISSVLDAVHEEGSPAAVRAAYDPPAGYGAAWNAALDFLEKPQ